MSYRWCVNALGAVAVVVAGTALAERVVRVKDGDSLVIASGGGQVDVRLADIDAPEYRQPHGDTARAALQALVDGREVRLQLVGGDAYRRIVAHVFAAGVDVNAEMVRRGHAWVRRAYDPAPRLIAAEDAARAERLGLWAQAAPTPPWEWRRRKRPPRAAAARAAPPDRVDPATVAAADALQVECGTKRYCREMASCEEALAFLRQCGLGTIDGDKDGMPCEALCRAPEAHEKPEAR